MISQALNSNAHLSSIFNSATALEDLGKPTVPGCDRFSVGKPVGKIEVLDTREDFLADWSSEHGEGWSESVGMLVWLTS